MPIEKTVPMFGATTFWKTTPSRLATLEAGLTALGLEKFIPPVRGDSDALRSATKDYCETNKDSDNLIQSLKRPSVNGFQVLSVDRQENDLDIEKEFGVKVHDGAVTVTRGYANQRKLQELFSEHKRVITSSAVSSALTRIVTEYFGGTCFKPGIYWIPEDHLDSWSQVAEAVKAASLENNTEVYELRFVMDASGVKALKDAIITEVTAANDRMNADIAKGDLTPGGLSKREIAAANLQRRITEYEQILGDCLDSLRDTTKTTQDALAAARSSKAATEQFDGVFA